MRYLLDTNVISELRKAGTLSIDPNVSGWAKSVDADNMFISVFTLMEIEKGILKHERKDKLQAQMLRQWFTQRVLSEFAERTLLVDAEIALYCARLHVPDKRSECDAWIAATAWRHELILVTRNVKDFAGMGVRLLNPWNQISC